MSWIYTEEGFGLKLLMISGSHYPMSEGLQRTGMYDSVDLQSVEDELGDTLPGDQTITIVTSLNGSVSTDGDLTITENLNGLNNAENPGSVDIGGYVPITITPTSLALSVPATPGTITVHYQATNGNAGSQEFSFATGALTTAQTIYIDMNFINRISNAGFNAGTVTITTPNTERITDLFDPEKPPALTNQLLAAQRDIISTASPLLNNGNLIQGTGTDSGESGIFFAQSYKEILPSGLADASAALPTAAADDTNRSNTRKYALIRLLQTDHRNIKKYATRAEAHAVWQRLRLAEEFTAEHEAAKAAYYVNPPAM